MTERTQPLNGLLSPEPTVGGEARRTSVAPGHLGTKLVGKEGVYAGHTFAFSGAVTTIGRDTECDVALVNDPTVSRRHARVVLEERGHVLYDEDSANGTFVNSVLVHTCVLAPGDTIQIGSNQLRYE
jgi:pSer/pThr/pTyr-binding forkhead associated (FHA) protein